MTKVAVVILNYNGIDFLQQFLPGVIKYSPQASIVVIDNGSEDNSISYLETLNEDVQTIRLEDNLGYAGGYNQGLQSVDADLLVLLNSDIEVTENWLAPVVNLFETNSELAACQPKILAHKQKDHFEYAGASGGYLDWLGYPFCRGRIFNCIEKDTRQYDDITRIFWASGACFCVRKSVFDALGGFDVDFFAHMEEIDLCWRINGEGYQIAACPESIIYHVGGGTLSASNPRKTYLNFRNSLEMLAKYLPWWKMIYTFPLRWMMDWAAALKFWSESESDHAGAVLKAHGAFLRRLPGIMKKRQGPARPVPTFKGSIAWQYYIRGRRHFSQLKFGLTDR